MGAPAFTIDDLDRATKRLRGSLSGPDIMADLASIGSLLNDVFMEIPPDERREIAEGWCTIFLANIKRGIREDAH